MDCCPSDGENEKSLPDRQRLIGIQAVRAGNTLPPLAICSTCAGAACAPVDIGRRVTLMVVEKP